LQKDSLKKALIIRLSSIGDIVLTTPVIRCLKLQMPETEIHFLTKKQFLPVVRHNPYIDKIILIEKSPDEVFDVLVSEKYDHIFDLHKNFRSIKLRRRLGVRSTSFDKLNFEKWLLVNFKIDRLPAVHIVDRYFEAVAGFGVKNDNCGLDYFLSDDDRVDMKQLPLSHRNGYVAFVVGGKHKTKQLPAEKAIRLCEQINRPVIILGGPDDVEAANEIAAQHPEKVFSGCGKFNLSQSASLVEQALVVISNDTGLMHIAAAFGKKLVTIWGNTVPQLGMYPYMPKQQDNFSIHQVNGLKCRPCSKIGFEKCPKKHFRCMMDQDVQAIAQRVNAYLSSDGR
jgi:ADP-heptose:LPS heptosyltransferase